MRKMLFLATLLVPSPALAYSWTPASYDITDYDLPQSGLDVIRSVLEGYQQGQVRLYQVESYWTGDPTGGAPNTVLRFHFSGRDQFTVGGITFTVDFTGIFSSVWDLDSESAGTGCTLQLTHVWSDVTSFSYDIQGVPPWLEGWFGDNGEELVRSDFVTQLQASMPLLYDSQTRMECAHFVSLQGARPTGDIGVPQGGTRTFYLTLRNTGEDTWDAGQYVKLSLNGDFGSPCYPYLATNRWYLSNPIAPGGTATFALTAAGVPLGATVQCDLQMVRDNATNGHGVHRFGEITQVPLTGTPRQLVVAN